MTSSDLLSARFGRESKPFQCEECPRSYSSKYALVRHARQHTNSHIRACPFCGRTSTRADIIRVHMNNCVKKYIRTIEETALQMQLSAPDAGDRPAQTVAADAQVPSSSGHDPGVE